MGKVVHFEIPVDDPDRARAVLRRGLRVVVPGHGDLHANPVVSIGVENIDAVMKAVAADGRIPGTPAVTGARRTQLVAHLARRGGLPAPATVTQRPRPRRSA